MNKKLLSQAPSAPDPNIKIDYENFDEYEIGGITKLEGVKYLKGGYGYYCGFDITKVSADSVIDDVMRGLPGAYSKMIQQ